jgi:hypothetical protein
MAERSVGMIRSAALGLVWAGLVEALVLIGANFL